MNTLENVGSILSRNWWLMLLRGIAAIAFGVLIFAKPQISLQVLVYLFGVYVLVEGILGIAVAVQARGVLEIAAAIRLRELIKNEWLLILAGLVSVAFGVLLIARPEAGVLAVLALIGVYAIVFGVLLVTFAFKIRSFVSKVTHA